MPRAVAGTAGRTSPESAPPLRPASCATTSCASDTPISLWTPECAWRMMARPPASCTGETLLLPQSLPGQMFGRFHLKGAALSNSLRSSTPSHTLPNHPFASDCLLSTRCHMTFGCCFLCRLISLPVVCRCCSRSGNGLHDVADATQEPCSWESYLTPNYTAAPHGSKVSAPGLNKSLLKPICLTCVSM